MMMSGVEVGEVGDGGHPGCVIDGESGGDGSRLSVRGDSGGRGDVSYDGGASANFGYSSENSGWRGDVVSATSNASGE